IKQGVPALFPGIGYFPGSPEEKMAHEWTQFRYHSPADDAKQPIDAEAAARFNELQRKLVLKVANSDPTLAVSVISPRRCVGDTSRQMPVVPLCNGSWNITFIS
ncbi:MAG: hypothetical protein WA761_10280, partial [Thermoplasmata archaeon]